MKRKNEKQNQKGITLIALVITIIVLLILAAVSIATLTGENGILTKASKAKEETQRAQIKEEAELAKTDLIIEESQDSTGTIKADREGIVNKLERTFENSYVEGYAVILDNGYEVFVNQKKDIIVRRYEESDVSSITASHATERWQEGITNIGWVASNLNQTATESSGVPIPVGFSIEEGNVDTGLVIKNDTTNDEFVWIPVDNKAKVTVTFKSKNDLKTVRGPEGATVDINKRTATVEFTTNEAGFYEFYAEDKNGESKYYDVDFGGINLKQESFLNNQYIKFYRANMTEAQKRRVYIEEYETSMGVELGEKGILKIINASLWENWDDVARSDNWWYTSLEDWYYNCEYYWNYEETKIDRSSSIKENATEEEMIQAFIDVSNDNFNGEAKNFEEIKQMYQTEYIDWYGEEAATISSLEEFVQLYDGCDTIAQYYEERSYTETIPEELQQSVANYGGFYVGRYETGTSMIRIQNKDEDTISNVLIQKNQYPYVNVTIPNAIIVCNNYEGKGNTNSHLLYGGEWDAIMQYIIDKQALGKDTYDKLTNESSSIEWGNYWSASFTFTGKYSTNYGKSFVEGSTTKPKDKWWLLATGVCDRNKVLNMYDIAGNCDEWTQELRSFSNSDKTYYVERAVVFNGGSRLNSVVGRSITSSTGSSTNSGFRIALTM